MYLLYLLKFIFPLALNSGDQSKEHYYIQFDKIDNRADIIVNDSLVYSSGTIDFNPELNETYTIYIGDFLTDKEDEVIVRLYNGHEPYENEEDTHWEIKYAILKEDVQVDVVWDYDDDGAIGAVFESTHYF